MIFVNVIGRTATAVSDDALTVGSIGIPVRFQFSPEWADLNKTVSFISGTAQADVQLQNDSCTVPVEVLTAPGVLWVGVYGVGDGVIMPTTKAQVGIIQPGATP